MLISIILNKRCFLIENLIYAHYFLTIIPKNFIERKFSFIAEAGTLLQKNGLKITKAKDGHHDFLNGFATFFTNKEISIPNVQMWRVILSEKKERTFSFFILYFIVLLIIGYVLGNNYQIEDESFPYYQYF